jgi:hypothetical protein
MRVEEEQRRKRESRQRALHEEELAKKHLEAIGIKIDQEESEEDTNN